MYIQNDGKDTLHYAYTDYQGSLVALADKSGNVKERYAFDPWGNRRNPMYWNSTETRTSFITNRGYTLHEHLDEFRLINMNGRVYDPYMALFMSPDPYVQAPGNWVNYNRYLYCYGNPMSFTDPSGEFIVAMILGAAINTAVQGFSGNLGGMSRFWKSMGVGAASGIAGSYAGGIFNTVGFLSGAVNGAAGGFAGGFVTGAGNAWASGQSFGSGLKSGLISGGIGAGKGALWGGWKSGRTASKNGGDFWTGKGTTFVNESIGYGDDFGGDYFKDNETMHEYINSKNGWSPGKYNVDDIDVVGLPKSLMDNGERATYYERMDNGTIMRFSETDHPHTVGGLRYTSQSHAFKSHSSIYMSPRTNLKSFTLTLNHELIHAYHYTLGLHNMMDSRSFRNFTEHSAYTYNYMYGGDKFRWALALKAYPYNGPFNINRWPSYLLPLP